MNTVNAQKSNRAHLGPVIAVVLAAVLGTQPAQAGTEEAIAGLLVGAILISAAQDSRADRGYQQAHYTEVSHHDSHAYRRDTHRRVEPTHRPKQRGHNSYHGQAYGHQRNYGQSYGYQRSDKHHRNDKQRKHDKHAKNQTRRHDRERYAQGDSSRGAYRRF